MAYEAITAPDVRKVKDPYLGWVWIIDCPWHGASGRYDSEDEAIAHARAYHAKCEVPKN